MFSRNAHPTIQDKLRAFDAKLVGGWQEVARDGIISIHLPAVCIMLDTDIGPMYATNTETGERVRYENLTKFCQWLAGKKEARQHAQFRLDACLRERIRDLPVEYAEADPDPMPITPARVSKAGAPATKNTPITRGHLRLVP